MKLSIIITEIGEGDSIAQEHYRRRAEVKDVQLLITALDDAIKQIPAPRKQRSDAGRKKGDA